MGLVEPVAGFLEGLRQACDEVGALLMFDEVITGFRLCFGGAAQWYGVNPDIWCFGKVIGGGLPMGAIGASTEIMSNLAPLGSVYQAGTLSGNPLATAGRTGSSRTVDPRLLQPADRHLSSFASRPGRSFRRRGC